MEVLFSQGIYIEIEASVVLSELVLGQGKRVAAYPCESHHPESAQYCTVAGGATLSN